MLSVSLVVLQYLFQQLGVIIAIVKLHIRSYLDDIFELIKVCSVLAKVFLMKVTCLKVLHVLTFHITTLVFGVNFYVPKIVEFYWCITLLQANV